jgi:trehalose 6-phosphate synthase/phosphatase
MQRWAPSLFEPPHAPDRPAASAGDALAPSELSDALAAAARAPRLVILLDYDGTLVPIAQSPDLAAPDAELVALLGSLSARPATEIHLVSGRPRHTLETWFAGLQASLWAEHGFWYRRAPGTAWIAAGRVPEDWMDRIKPILEQFTASTPGSIVEKKSASVAWHYRRADGELGARQAHELRLRLGGALSDEPLEVLEGKKVVEVRMRGISKALVAKRIRPAVGAFPAIIAIGDDRTDEDLFSSLPAEAVTIAVGTGRSLARYRLPDSHAVRGILRSLLG